MVDRTRKALDDLLRHGAGFSRPALRRIEGSRTLLFASPMIPPGPERPRDVDGDSVGYPSPPVASLLLDCRAMASPPSVAEAFRATLELFETGVDLMRQNLRRAQPEASDDEIERRLAAWLAHRPGAEAGDSAGRPVDVSTRFA